MDVDAMGRAYADMIAADEEVSRLPSGATGRGDLHMMLGRTRDRMEKQIRKAYEEASDMAYRIATMARKLEEDRVKALTITPNAESE